ncbi:MAG: 4-hydroxyphenylpyruvate dioxygenase [Deltaproteobacteria bacterium RIFCSPHIGHO2_02_FULL_40_11]|nr:MAG: 4-hydroxyphenylpyruvate dioxygenase [Deltaproteobacteria bacterium RIFCSPHIGHO2_02_FULL_40_11]
MANTLGIRRFDYVEFYVGSAKMVAYWFAKSLGLKITGYMGPETGVKDKVSYYLCKNKLQFVVTGAPCPENSQIWHPITHHGDGVKRFALNVDSVEHAFSYALKNGAIPIHKPHRLKDEKGFVEEATIKVYDDAEICFTNRSEYKGLFKPGYEPPLDTMDLRCQDTGLLAIDHIVGNVRQNEMDHWANYLNKAMDFETFVDFGPGDISTQYSALLSKVVRSKDNVIKLPINEPYLGLKMSQIEEYIQEYRGTGIQHIAISTPDIISSIQALRANGIDFLEVPDTYYDELRHRKIQISENLDDLQKLKILCDVEGQGYLLQIFTKPIGDRPTFFFEIIQRQKGAQGFGQGNFKALFEAIEHDQKRRGNW